jgi:hypothetical protein
VIEFKKMKLNKIDENYENKMVAFESDCNDGKGEAIACHHVLNKLSIQKCDRCNR